MSRLRTSHTSDGWLDLGPSTPHSFVSGFATRPALQVGSMLPVMRIGANLENRHRRKPPKAHSIHPENAR
jgi:hypothetical protein